jgi:hypothetical protein
LPTASWRSVAASISQRAMSRAIWATSACGIRERRWTFTLMLKCMSRTAGTRLTRASMSRGSDGSKSRAGSTPWTAPFPPSTGRRTSRGSTWDVPGRSCAGVARRSGGHVEAPRRNSDGEASGAPLLRARASTPQGAKPWPRLSRRMRRPTSAFLSTSNTSPRSMPPRSVGVLMRRPAVEAIGSICRRLAANHWGDDARYSLAPNGTHRRIGAEAQALGEPAHRICGREKEQDRPQRRCPSVRTVGGIHGLRAYRCQAINAPLTTTSLTHALHGDI